MFRVAHFEATGPVAGDPSRSALGGLRNGGKVIGEGREIEIGTQAVRAHRRILCGGLRPATISHLPVLMAGGRVPRSFVATREDALHIFRRSAVVHESFAKIEHGTRNVAN